MWRVRSDTAETTKHSRHQSSPSPASPSAPWFSDDHRVRLSLSNCMISVLSLYNSSFSVSSSAIASSDAVFARLRAFSGEFGIS